MPPLRLLERRTQIEEIASIYNPKGSKVAKYQRHILSKEMVHVQVENYQGDFIPRPFTYITKSIILQSHTVPKRRFVGCECDSCGKGSNCCSELMMTRFAYSADGQLQRNTSTIIECGEACSCGLECINRQSQRQTVSICLFKPSNRGWGVRSMRAIECGTFVGNYYGEIISEEEADKRGNSAYQFELSSLGQKYIIDSKNFGNFTRFINHSCKPNLSCALIRTCSQSPADMKVGWVFGSKVVNIPHALCSFFASKRIPVGVEMTIDYARTGKLSDCYCGATHCRGKFWTEEGSFYQSNKRVWSHEVEFLTSHYDAS